MDKLVGFLWSPAKHLWDSILSEISEEYTIENSYTYNFGEDIGKLEECVIDIYKTDDISIDKVKNIKLKSMRRSSNEFLMFYINIDDPEYRKKEKTGNDISQAVERIKKKVRNKYQKYVDGYIHDIIIHLADNDIQTHKIESDIPKYQKFMVTEFVNLKTLLKHQFIDGEFNRVDMLVRAYSAKHYLEDENYNFALYKKMCSLRGGCCVDKFKELINSFKRSGFDVNFPIPVNISDYRIMTGSHRFALSYQLDIEMVPVMHVARNLETGEAIEDIKPYDKKWFQSNTFTKDELNIINHELEKLNYKIK